jgi:hypothetical protein
MKTVMKIYALQGFRVWHRHVHGEFAPTRNAMLDISILLNVVSQNEHVPEVERYIWTIKE